MPAGPARSPPRGSRSGHSAGATRSCPGPGSTRGRSRRSACASRTCTGNRSTSSKGSGGGISAGGLAPPSPPSIRARSGDLMGGHQIDTEEAASGQAAAPRSFLFLQGPISDFFDRLGRALIARGHHVHRINLHFGDALFWRLPATPFRGHFDEWRAFIGEMLETHQVTDLVMHGDRRPYHIVAAEEARARGIGVIATDLGYVRPDWITLERDGMSTYSRFPREPAAIRALAEEFPPPDLTPRFHPPFWLISVLDVAYNFGLVLGRPFYPHYRYHGISHPFTEYAGWVWSRAKRLVTGRVGATEKSRLQTAPGSYFLFPLQLATAFHIRAP